MDSSAPPASVRAPDSFMSEYTLNRRIRAYKECCFRAYGYGLASLALVSSISYFGMTTSFKYVPIRRKYFIFVSGFFGCIAGYQVSKAMSQDCNSILKAHRESLQTQGQSNEKLS